MAGQRMVGDYVLTQHLGTGSFAVVWKGKHKVTGEEVAIKEIASDKLTSENLMSEINILKKTDHPNIIRLYDTISTSNRIFLVLEYCAGGDLGGYIQHHGRVREGIARHFMQQLGAGLQVLRANNLIHRDLKPQNLLLSSSDDNAVLKIADFGFARSLQPQGMAETLCGSPLYMAPEILQSKKYDAKADLWSVGTIFYQLVTGQPPFTGQNPIQLLQNIQRSTELHFPKFALTELHPECIDLCRKLLRKDPVERLSFEEFFEHSFIAKLNRCGPIHRSLPFSCERSFQDQPMPFQPNENPQFNSTSPTCVMNTTHQASPLRFLRSSGEKGAAQSFSEQNFLKDIAKEGLLVGGEGEQSGFSVSHSKGAMVDSMEILEKEYVLVSMPSTSTDAISFPASKKYTCAGDQSPCRNSQKVSMVNAPLPKAGSWEIGHCREDQKTSHGSCDVADCLTRLHVLQKCAETIADLAHDKYTGGQYLEAFSTQLVCLAIWKKALSFSSKRADGFSRTDTHATEGSESSNLYLLFLDIPEKDYGIETLCLHIERKFCSAVEQAERFGQHLQSLDGSTVIPDAIEIIFQAALTTGIRAAADEVIENLANAAMAYTKAAILLYFLLVEAGSLPISPRLVLDRSDKQRLRYYIEMIATRQSLCSVRKINPQR